MHKSRCRYVKRDPEFAHCKTRRVGAVLPGIKLESFYCSLDNADCSFARPFAYDYMCKHSNSHTFATGEDL